MSDLLSVQRVVPAPPEPIFDLLADPARRQRLAQEGRLRIADCFSTEVIAARWEHYYRRLLGLADNDTEGVNARAGRPCAPVTG